MFGVTRMCDAASVVRRALRTSEGTSSDSVQSREGRWRRPQSAEGNERLPPRESWLHVISWSPSYSYSYSQIKDEILVRIFCHGDSCFK